MLAALGGTALMPAMGGVTGVVEAAARESGATLREPGLREAEAQAEVTATPPFANRVLNRMGFGVTDEQLQHFMSLGGDDRQRLQAYVEEQLDWRSIDDSELEARLGDPSWVTLDMELQALWERYRIDAGRQGDTYRPLDEGERIMLLRATYSKRQLLEFLVDFWHNHFNIYGRDTYAHATWISWDRDVIRPPTAAFPRPQGLEHAHVMGNFRQLLELTSKHPAMLYYLDNHVNGRGDPNENYAREIIELHTLGAINYAGPDPGPGDIQQIVTADYPDGFHDKYSDADVYEAMRFLTGWNLEDGRNPSGDDNTGNWHFVEDWHDQQQKQLLGRHWPAYYGINEVYEMFDLLAYHPGTARHIALKLCRRFLADEPPQSLVDRVAQAFFDNRYEPDQLQQVYRVLLLSDEFSDQAGWGQKLKRPVEAVVSAMRACDADILLRPRDENGDNDYYSRYLLYYLQLSGQRPFNWPAPDGYPDQRTYWEAGASLVNTWRTLDWLIDSRDPDLLPVTRLTLEGVAVPTPDSVTGFWLNRILKWEPAGGWPGTTLFTILRDFMRKRPDGDPALWPADHPIEGIDENSWPNYWNQRLRGLVKLILATPEFMQR